MRFIDCDGCGQPIRHVPGKRDGELPPLTLKGPAPFNHQDFHGIECLKRWADQQLKSGPMSPEERIRVAR